MRPLLFSFVFAPLPVLADTFVVPSRATEALVFPGAGLVTHEVMLSLPAGAHEVILPDLPQSADVSTLRVTAPGVKLGAIRLREDFVPPRPDRDDPRILAAEDRIKEIETQIQEVRDTAAIEGLALDAAKARIAFLTALGDSDTLPNDPQVLRETARMIGQETLAARQDMLRGEQAVRRILEGLVDLEDNLNAARQALEALVPEPKDRPFVSLSVVAGQAADSVPLRVSFYAQMGWQPGYDVRLSDGDVPQVTLDRYASVVQYTGENWENVRLTLSSQTPEDQIEPGYLPSDLRRLIDPQELARVRKLSVAQADMAPTALAEPAVEAPVILEEAAQTTLSASGLEVQYSFSDVVSVASGADALRIPFDSLTLPATLVARAVPFSDDRAYLVAQVTNDTSEPLLPSYETFRFFDGSLVGAADFPEMAPGAEIELGFGPIDGLKLTRTILARNEGDRGIISRSNAQTERTQITVENLTQRTWSVQLQDRVPYSEQEDLEITYTADPRPDVRTVEDRRGILQWNLEMAPGALQVIETSFDMAWPEGQIVR